MMIQIDAMAVPITGHLTRTGQCRELQQGDRLEHEKGRCTCCQHRAWQVLETLLCRLFLEYDAGLDVMRERVDWR